MYIIYHIVSNNLKHLKYEKRCDETSFDNYNFLRVALLFILIMQEYIQYKTIIKYSENFLYFGIKSIYLN